MGKLFIREAELSDWLPVCDVMKEIHSKAPYGVVEYNEDDAKRIWKLSVVSNRHLSLVVTDKKHRIYGLIMAQTSMNWWGAKVATELVSYTNKPGFMAWLLRRYKRWATEQGCQIVAVVNTSGENERYDRLIEKLGFVKAGTAFMAFPQEAGNG